MRVVDKFALIPYYNLVIAKLKGYVYVYICS